MNRTARLGVELAGDICPRLRQDRQPASAPSSAWAEWWCWHLGRSVASSPARIGGRPTPRRRGRADPRLRRWQVRMAGGGWRRCVALFGSLVGRVGGFDRWVWLAAGRSIISGGGCGAASAGVAQAARCRGRSVGVLRRWPAWPVRCPAGVALMLVHRGGPAGW